MMLRTGPFFAALTFVLLVQGCFPVLPAPTTRNLAQGQLLASAQASYPNSFFTPQLSGKLSYGLSDDAELGAGAAATLGADTAFVAPSIDAHYVVFDWIKMGASGSYAAIYTDEGVVEHHFFVQPRITSVTTSSMPFYLGVQARKYLPWDRDTYVSGLLGREVDADSAGTWQLELGFRIYHHSNAPGEFGETDLRHTPNMYYLSFGRHFGL